MRNKMKKHRNIKVALIAIGALALFAATGVFAHDEGHPTPGQLPPIGPNGGKYAKLERHFAETVVKGNTLTLYILEPDVKNVAEDATGVTAAYEVPGKSSRREIKLKKSGAGYTATISIAPGARRVIFFVSCVLDGKRESGRVVYEPKR
ncbi:MAG: hypothetical protein RIF32_21580 [Leptospirales bacterium]|jgi:hypothetical protein